MLYDINLHASGSLLKHILNKSRTFLNLLLLTFLTRSMLYMSLLMNVSLSSLLRVCSVSSCVLETDVSLSSRSRAVAEIESSSTGADGKSIPCSMAGYITFSAT